MNHYYTRNDYNAYMELYKSYRKQAAENARYIKKEAESFSIREILWWSARIQNEITRMNAYKQKAFNIENELR